MRVSSCRHDEIPGGRGLVLVVGLGSRRHTHIHTPIDCRLGICDHNEPCVLPRARAPDNS